MDACVREAHTIAYHQAWLSAGLTPCRPGFKAGWGDFSLPSLHNLRTFTSIENRADLLLPQVTLQRVPEWLLKHLS